MIFRTVSACVILMVFGLVPFFSIAATPPSPEQEVEALVRAAVDLIKAKGEAAFPEFQQKGSQWLANERYIFACDETGLERVNGIDPSMVGKNLWDYQDPKGRYVVRDEVALVKAKGSGWYECLWPKPGQAKAVKCRSFILGVTVNGRLLAVGSPIFGK